MSGKTVGILLLVVVLAILASFINHRIRLNQESDLFAPLGQTVTVNGNAMSVYTEGEGAAPLVFMAGSGTASPILDFRSLYSHLSDDHEIAVAERLGYGFSDVADEPRDVRTVLEETRASLEAADVRAPFVLVPHSMAVLEALLWAQLYPDEVSAIIGLDPAVPGIYQEFDLPGAAMLELLHLGARVGITRFFPAVVDDSAAIKAGSLTEAEKDIYRAVFYRRTETRPMVEEIKTVKKNAEMVSELPSPQVPMLFFTSNGEGTALDVKQWRQQQIDFLTDVAVSEQVFLESGHYVHDHDHEEIAARSERFLHALGIGADA